MYAPPDLCNRQCAFLSVSNSSPLRLGCFVLCALQQLDDIWPGHLPRGGQGLPCTSMTRRYNKEDRWTEQRDRDWPSSRGTTRFEMDWVGGAAWRAAALRRNRVDGVRFISPAFTPLARWRHFRSTTMTSRPHDARRITCRRKLAKNEVNEMLKPQHINWRCSSCGWSLSNEMVVNASEERGGRRTDGAGWYSSCLVLLPLHCSTTCQSLIHSLPTPAAGLTSDYRTTERRCCCCCWQTQRQTGRTLTPTCVAMATTNYSRANVSSKTRNWSECACWYRYEGFLCHMIKQWKLSDETQTF